MNRSYLICRGGVYHFRMRVPKNLIPIIGQKEIHRSLKTSNRRVAQSMAHALHGKTEATFALLNQQIMLEIRPEQVQPSTGLSIAGRLPIQHVSHETAAATNGMGTNPGQDRLKDLITMFVQDRSPNWVPKTKQMHTTALRQFENYVGNKSVDQITRKNCRAFKQTLEKLPPHWERRFKNWSINKILALELEPMNPRSVNGTLSIVSSFFNWAVQEEFIRDNPARGLRIPNTQHPDNERNIFSRNELRFLFEQSPLYAGSESARRRTKPGSLIIKDARFWMPLIAHYSGMRLEEIAQLGISDVRHADGVKVFDVNASSDKKLKTTYSARLVPLHPVLEKLGFSEYVSEVAETGKDRLWPEFKRTRYGVYSPAFSAWFGKYKREIGITDPRVTFHSFRHTAINHLKQKDVPENRIKELVGHKDSSITMSRYGKRYEPQVLLETVKLLDYELNHSHLEVARCRDGIGRTPKHRPRNWPGRRESRPRCPGSGSGRPRAFPGGSRPRGRRYRPSNYSGSWSVNPHRPGLRVPVAARSEGRG